MPFRQRAIGSVAAQLAGRAHHVLHALGADNRAQLHRLKRLWVVKILWIDKSGSF